MFRVNLQERNWNTILVTKIIMDKNNYCIIMAGGVGSRFWPLSKEKRPKQFLDILGTGKTLIRQTFDRMAKVCPQENIFIVTSYLYKELTLSQLPILESNILLEPARKNTAPCIAYANERIRLLNPNANIVVAPADHLILDEVKFIEVIINGLNFTKNNNELLTIGITPTRIETGYGYIQVKESDSDLEIQKVKTFTEKPDLKLAKFFVESGEFLWNSGIFIWSLSSITDAFEKYQSDILNLFNAGKSVYSTVNEPEFIEATYSECKNISIDYGIMESAENVSVYKASFGWSDLGTWGSLYDNSTKDENNNVVNNENILVYDTQNTIINVSKDMLVAVEGLDNYIIAESNGALLICRKSEEQKIRQIVNDVKFKKGDSYI